MSVLAGLKGVFVGRNSITDFGDRYPDLDKNNMSSIKDLYIVGNIAGTPDIRAALNAGHAVGARLAEAPQNTKSNADYDVVIVGGGPSALACAAALRESGKTFLILERRKLLATVRAFKPDLWLYNASTGDYGNRSFLPYSEMTAHDLLIQWEALLSKWQLPAKENAVVEGVTKEGAKFRIEVKGEESITASQVVLATGKLIQLEKLGAAQAKFDCREVEHSIAKSDQPETMAACKLVAKSGIRMERDLDLKGIAFLGSWMIGILLMYLWLYYGEYTSGGKKVVPFTDLAVDGWFAYSTIYTAAIWFFGIKAIRRWKDPLQTKKFSLLIASQTLLFWAIPTFVFTKISGFSTPASGYELGYIWPLAVKPENLANWLGRGGWTYYMFMWNMILSFLIIPIFAFKYGKKYCSWICGCGGLAETLGDSWRHYSPKGKDNKAREKQGYWIAGFAVIACAAVFMNVAFPKTEVIGDSAGLLTKVYGGFVDIWLIGIIPVMLYPFMGGKIWCRFWCPSAVYMQLVSKFWATFKKKQGAVTGFSAIHSDKKRCIACNMCTRNCEIGIDVRSFAIKGNILDNTNSSCIGCGICISVCPTDTLKFNVLDLAKETDSVVG